MKRNFVFTLLLLTALCVMTTGCGSRQNDTTSGSTVQDTMQDSGQNGSSSNGGSPSNGSSNGSSSSNGSGSSSGSLMDDMEQGLENAGDAITGNSSHGSASSGVPYDDLLSDGKVTDHDGNLNNDTSAARSRSR